MEWRCGFCLTLQLACCCGTAACSLCCKCCPKIKQSTSTRFMYALYFILVTIICCVMMSTTVANEMKTHVSKRDEPTAARGSKWGSFHSSSCVGALPQKRRSIPSIHPLPNPDGMIGHAQPLSVNCSPVECVSEQEESRIIGLAAFLLSSCRNLLQWTHPSFAAQVVSLVAVREHVIVEQIGSVWRWVRLWQLV